MARMDVIASAKRIISQMRATATAEGQEPKQEIVTGGPRLVILLNDNVKMSRGKAAAQAVHAALAFYGHLDHGAVVVLGASPTEIETQCRYQIRDAGLTEIAAGTLTAGVRVDSVSSLEGYKLK